MSEQRKVGNVKWFSVKKGYGFIIDEEGNDVFVHSTGITEGRKNGGLKENDEVTFIIIEGKTGPQAGDVKLLHS